MDLSTLIAALTGLVIGCGIGAALVLPARRRARPPAPRAADPAPLRSESSHDLGPDQGAVPPAVTKVLTVLRSSGLVIDASDQVLQASSAAYTMGLVAGHELRVPELLELVHSVRGDGRTRALDLDVRRGRGRSPALVHARVAQLSGQLVLVLADDRSRERRVDAVRRDFVANVSHELKTPVGALMLLAEAVEDAADDPEAVRRFAGRMRTEASRLTRLVLQIIELSRLQSDELVDRPVAVDLDRVVDRALDISTIESKARDIEVVWDGRRELWLHGNEDQLVLALSNLVANAVTYSGEHSRVTVSAQPAGDGMVDLTVADEGIGIPSSELERIFERFYRVDPARHRSTGGTGLGLSIVKHVAATHGGEISVWSREGQGSVFTLRLPRYTQATAESTVKERA
jgi:two-component system, OmpR family, sensor histidine kinase SenX3